ncbi:MAG: hypothetical protein OCD76_24825, partial [Reichenbachiella sp.]
EAIEFEIRPDSNYVLLDTSIYPYKDTLYIHNWSLHQLLEMRASGEDSIQEGAIREYTLVASGPHLSSHNYILLDVNSTAIYGEDFIIYDSLNTPGFYNDSLSRIKWTPSYNNSMAGDSTYFKFYVEILNDSIGVDSGDETIILDLRKSAGFDLITGTNSQ